MIKKVLSIVLVIACIMSFSVVFADEVQSGAGSSATSALLQSGQTVGSSVYDITQYNYFWDPIKVVRTRTVSFQDPWRRIYSYKNSTPKEVTATISQTYTVTNSYSGNIQVGWSIIQAQLGINLSASITRTYQNTTKVPPYTTFYLEAAGTGSNIYFDVYVPHAFDSGYAYAGSGWIKNYTGISFWGHY